MDTTTCRKQIAEIVANLPDRHIEMLTLSGMLRTAEAYDLVTRVFPDLTVWPHKDGGATLISDAFTFDVPPHIYQEVKAR